VLFLLLVFAFSFPSVQTRAAQYLTNNLNETYGTDIKIDKVSLTYKGSVKLGTARALDHKKDTVLAFKELETSIISFGDLFAGEPDLGATRIDGLYFNMVRYKGDTRDNLMLFLEKFRTTPSDPNAKPFKLKVGALTLTNARVNVEDEESTLPILFRARDMNLDAQSLSIINSEIHAPITDANFTMFTSAMRYGNEEDGLVVKNLQTDLTYTREYIYATDLELTTAASFIKGDLALNYTVEGFSDFNNKVQWDFSIDDARVATNELRYFYNEILPNEQLQLQGDMSGTLNNIVLKNLDATALNDIAIKGDMHLTNLLDNRDDFFIEGTFILLQASARDLEEFLPNILGGIFPQQVTDLGTVTAAGYASVDRNTLVSKLKGTSNKAAFDTDLVMGDITSGNASYDGRIKLDNLDVGKLAGIAELGNTSLDVIVHGRGFSVDQLNTTVQGDVTSLTYNGYTYKDIEVDGTFKKPLFDGRLAINDPNLTMDFNGLVDFSKKENIYKFDANIGFADLKAINLFTRDDVSVLKGRVVMDMQGTTLDDVKGHIDFFDTSYRNENQDYYFEDFKIESLFRDDERFITINSPDIVEGEISGKFILAEIPELFKNAIGSVYTNYRSKTITRDQYMSYEFQIYDKIVDLFFPDIALGENTIIKGQVASNESLFKLTFRTPEINAFDVLLDNVNVQIDNQNPLFNTFIKIDNVKNGVYDVDDFRLINVTRQDTLLFRTEFVSKDRAEDKYNLSFYHTVNAENSSVVGIRTSDITFQGNKWTLNEQNKDVQLRFDHDFKSFALDTLLIRHNEERVLLAGELQGNDTKNIKLDFDNVRIASLLKPMDSLDLRGRINGSLNVKQKVGKYRPSSDFTIKELAINETDLGDFDMQVLGNEDLTRYTINAQLADERSKTFKATGFIDTSGEESTIEMDAVFTDFNLVALNPFGGIVVDNIRGLTSGRAQVRGPLLDPKVDGSLRLIDAGLRVPYLNTDFDIQNNSIVDITSKTIDFNDLKLTDTKYNTSGILGGRINHQNFGFWNLDLSVSSKRLLVLDTELTAESLYYGTAFIDGDATIKGPTDKIEIVVTATSEKGTIFKVPINDGESVADTSAIYFLSPAEKAAKISGKVLEQKAIGGLELVFDLKITPDAEVEITVDPANGSNLNGRGYGNLKLEINTSGKFVMNGDFIVTEGIYNFKYLGLVNKGFIIEPGGTIDWNGDPIKANINVSAVYKTNANPSVLLDNPNLNAQIPVEVVTTLDGNLTYFDPQFNIRFPNASSVVTSELQYRLQDKAQRQLQALSLVGTGSFYNPNSIGQNAVSGNLVESFTGIVNDLVRNEDSRFDFGVSYEASERNPNSDIQRSDRFGITLSTQITDRILINGRLGVPVGTTSATERAIIGNVEVEFLINDDGTLRLKLFNRENSLQQIGQQENYTQGIGLQYSVDFDTIRELYEKLFRKNLQRQTTFKTSDSAVKEVPIK
jgi:hypothetical protein